MSQRRRLAFARARAPVAVAMRIVAAALAALDPQATARRSVFMVARPARRAIQRDAAPSPTSGSARGCEDLH
jgi:hypothetical protein